MHRRASADFWNLYSVLPNDIRARADKQFALLQFKKIGDRRGSEVWSARVTRYYRALAIRRDDGYLWFWIGNHKAYDLLMRR